MSTADTVCLQLIRQQKFGRVSIVIRRLTIYKRNSKSCQVLILVVGVI